MRAPAPDGAAVDYVPDPDRPFLAEIGGGVSAAIPLSVYADADGSLPQLAVVSPALPALTQKMHTANDRATRLADIALAWNVFQHFYPYFDVVEVDWEAQLRYALQTAALDSNEGEFLSTLRTLVAALNDGHGQVIHPREGRIHLLPLLWDWVEDRLVVSVVADGVDSLQPGDVILRIDGQNVRDLLTAEEALISSATPQWRRFRALQRLRTSVETGEVQLEVESPGGGLRTVTLARSRTTAGLSEAYPEVVEEVEPGIWYVDLRRVTTEQFRSALSELAAADGLVFDLRGYPTGGAREILRHLIDGNATSAQWQVPVVTRPDRQDMAFDRSGWHLTPLTPHLSAPRVFITNEAAISYAESVMGIVEYYRLGEIVGAATAGTNGNVNSFTLPGGYSVTWTGMRVVKQDGSTHHGVGIRPTIPLSRTIAGIAAGRDELLEAAIARLQGAI